MTVWSMVRHWWRRTWDVQASETSRVPIQWTKTALFESCENNDPATVRAACAAGVSTEPFEVGGDPMDTPWRGVGALGVAMQFGSWDAVEALLDQGVDVCEPIVFPFNITWAGKSGRPINLVPPVCLMVARLTGQASNSHNLERARHQREVRRAQREGQEPPALAGWDQDPAVRRLKNFLARFIEAGADPERPYQLIARRAGQSVALTVPRTVLDHLLVSHADIIPSIPLNTLTRLGVASTRDTNDLVGLHLLSWHQRNPEVVLEALTTLVRAGMDPNLQDVRRRTAFNHWAQTQSAQFFDAVMDRLPAWSMLDVANDHGETVLDVWEKAQSAKSESSAAEPAPAERLRKRSIDRQRAWLREALPLVESSMTAPSVASRARL